MITLFCTLLSRCDTTVNNMKLPDFTFSGGLEHIAFFCFMYAVSVFHFFFILIFLQLLVRRILKNEGSRPTYRLLGYLSVFQLGISFLLAVYQVRKLRSIDLTFLVKEYDNEAFRGVYLFYFFFFCQNTRKNLQSNQFALVVVLFFFSSILKKKKKKKQTPRKASFYAFLTRKINTVVFVEER